MTNVGGTLGFHVIQMFTILIREDIVISYKKENMLESIITWLKPSAKINN